MLSPEHNKSIREKLWILFELVLDTLVKHIETCTATGKPVRAGYLGIAVTFLRMNGIEMTKQPATPAYRGSGDPLGNLKRAMELHRGVEFVYGDAKDEESEDGE